MTFSFTTEQEELRRTVRDFCRDRSSEAEVRRLMDTEHGYDPGVWQQMAQMGLMGLAIPEVYDGAGCTWTEVGIVMEEAGRTLLCAPYYSTVVLGAAALLVAGDEAIQKEYLPGMAAGSMTATLAVTEDSGDWHTDAISLEARKSDTGWLLNGHKSFVIDGHTSDLVIVAARTSAGISLFAVDGSAPGLTRGQLSTMDLTRKLARLEFRDVPARLIGEAGTGAEVVRRVLDIGAVGLAAEQVGGAQRVLDMAVEHATTRYQFGRPIGSFQAIKHTCADMLVAVESARSAAYFALATASEDGDDLSIAASLAKAYCSDAFFDVAAKNIQVHGGIGFTWEHPGHLYLKRAKADQLMLGDASYHRSLLADCVGI